MGTDTLDTKEVEIRNNRVRGIRDVSNTSTIGVRSLVGSTETSYAVFVLSPSLIEAVFPWQPEAPPVELEEQRFENLKRSEEFLRELSKLEEDWKKVKWSEDITERIDITTLVSEYLKGNVQPSKEADERIKKAFEKVAENPPFPTAEETMKWLRGH